MNSLRRRLSKLEARRPDGGEGILWLREGEKIKDALARYKAAGLTLANGWMICEEGWQGLTPEQWAAKCIARNEQPFTWYAELKELGLA